jgi:xanthine dehydrogenase YagR molybdenum-binding subunit
MTLANNTVTMDQPAERNLLDGRRQGLVGKPLDRTDGPAKVSGLAHYSYEQQVPNCAYGFALTAEIGHGRVTKIDTEAARKAAGVIAVIVDHPLLPADSATVMDGRTSPRQDGKIESYGEPLGIVVAESFEAARGAAKLVRVEHAAEPGRYDMSAHFADAEHHPKGPLTPEHDQGDLEAALAKSDVTFDATFTTPHHLPHPLEPHATIASWDGDTVEIRGSLQLLKMARGVIAASLEIAPEQVRVLAPFLGGGFGGKTGVCAETILAAIAAREIGRPVKIAMTRRQMAHLVHNRSQTSQRVRLGVTKDGHILAIGHENHLSQKPGRGFIEPVALGGHSLYAGPARRFSQSVVRLDLPVASAVRAPGEAIGMLALETAMDEMAEKLGLDPIEFRKRNEPERDPLRGVPFSSRRIVDCYDEGASRFGWEKRKAKPGQTREGEWLIGMGMAAASRSNLLAESAASVRLTRDGRAIVETDMTDIGTGTYTILTQVAGEMLGLPMDRVEVRLGDTNMPSSGGSGGSWGAASTASSVALACQTIIAELAKRMDARPDELALQDGYATARNRRVPIADLLSGADLEAAGIIKQGKNNETNSQWTWGAQFAEVAVSSVTGEVRLRRMLGVFDCGRILNAKTARSQAIGGMIWGISYALYEEAVVDRRTGAFVTRDLAEYHVPANADIPQIEAYFVEENDLIANPLGVKGIGELGISGAGAAVTNAIYNACGVRVRDFPLTLDKILEGLPAM